MVLGYVKFAQKSNYCIKGNSYKKKSPLPEVNILFPFDPTKFILHLGLGLNRWLNMLASKRFWPFLEKIV